MKLGPAGQNYSEAVKRWARVAPITKLIDDPGIFNDTPDSAIKLFRAYVGDGNKDVQAVYRTIIGNLKGYRHANLYCEIVNEPPQFDSAFIDFAEQMVGLLHAAGIKVAAPCWSTGTPEENTWQAWRARGWAGIDACALHGYWGSQGFTPWHALRFPRFWQPGDPPVIVSECGRDAIEGGKGGWKRDGLSPQAYAAELLAFNAELEKLPYVLGATPFTGGPAPEWDNFDTDPLVDLILAGQPPPPPAGIAWSGAFARFAAGHPEVGQPIGDIAYHPEPGAWITAGQVSRTHLLVWDGAKVTAIRRGG